MLSIRRGQVWTSLVRIAADARAEEHRARMMRAADEHAKVLALAVADEEICACRVEILRGTGKVTVGHVLDKAATAEEVDRLRATAPKVPPPRPGAERFEAPLVRDRATVRAMGNKYATAPAGTRAEHKRPIDTVDAIAQEAALLRTERCKRREEIQRWRRLTRQTGQRQPTPGALRMLVGLWC